MYRRILVPLDGSHRAEQILPHVEELALHFGSRLFLLRVVEPVPVLAQPPGPVVVADEGSQRLEQAKVYLRAWRGEFREKGISTEIQVEQGDVVRRIIETAEQVDADLIAMASHGRSGLSRAFYGSVAAGVLHHIERPLLLIRSLSGD